MENKNDHIYVVLVRAHTGLGSFARAITGYQYTHIAFCMNEQLEDFLTFSRRRHYAPFDSGFMHETLDCYAFGDHKKVKLKVFKVPVSDLQKRRIERFVSGIEADKDYLFNLYSMATMPLFHGFRIYKAHNCMSFVGKVLELAGALPGNDPKRRYYKYSIKDMDKLLTGLGFFYDEDDYYKSSILMDDYMEKVSFLSNLKMFADLNFRLIYRVIRYKVKP